MPLDSLLALVEKIRERIRDHAPALRQNEALTRYALIDPLLRELGWDTENPDLVIPEYNVDGKRADYALLRDDKPVMMVEAKKLDSPLQDAVKQGILYCQEQGTHYFSVTDGGCWEIYEPHKPVPMAEKRIVQFDLKDGSAAEECLKTLALWRPNVDPGRIAPGQAPVVGSTSGQPAQPGSPIPNPQPTPPSPDGHEWQPISELKPQKGDPSLKGVRFPDGTIQSVKAWGGLIVEVTRWLVDGNYLKTDHCPILSSPTGTAHYAVARKPVHGTGRQFTIPVAVGPLYVERGLGKIAITTAVRFIIERVGQDPAQFKVRFS